MKVRCNDDRKMTRRQYLHKPGIVHSQTAEPQLKLQAVQPTRRGKDDITQTFRLGTQESSLYDSRLQQTHGRRGLVERRRKQSEQGWSHRRKRTCTATQTLINRVNERRGDFNKRECPFHKPYLIAGILLPLFLFFPQQTRLVICWVVKVLTSRYLAVELPHLSSARNCAPTLLECHRRLEMVLPHRRRRIDRSLHFSVLSSQPLACLPVARTSLGHGPGDGSSLFHHPDSRAAPPACYWLNY